MGMKEDLNEVKDKIKEIRKENEENSFAMEMLQFSKEQNKQQHKHNVFLGWIIVLIILCLVGSNAYWIYQYTNTANEETTEETIDVQDVEQIDNSTIKIGDGIWEKSN